MAEHIYITKNTKGSYTLEASIFLPLVILAVISLGYYMRVEGTWESCIHGAVDESMLAASKAYEGGNAASIGSVVSRRINDDNPQLTRMKISNIKVGYSDGRTDELTSYRIIAEMDMGLPLGFGKSFYFEQRVKYRGFTGKYYSGVPMGTEGLQNNEIQQAVWIFPHSGEKYHSENCTYVKSTAFPQILTSALKRKHDSCDVCKSENLSIGVIVFCFKGENTAYHSGNCGTIVRNTTVIDKSEAVKRGLTPCSKCGGV